MEAIVLLPLLGCVAMMGVMMWMMRGHGSSHTGSAPPDPNVQEEIAILRAEIARMRMAQTEQGGTPDGQQDSAHHP